MLEGVPGGNEGKRDEGLVGWGVGGVYTDWHYIVAPKLSFLQWHCRGCNVGLFTVSTGHDLIMGVNILSVSPFSAAPPPLR